MKNSIFIILLSGILNIANADTLQAFTSDGCSAFPDGTFEQQQLWLACCTAHDTSYWKGGSHQQRLDADLELERCVSAVGEPLIAELMLAGVRVGGSPYWPTKFRWGYGWSYARGYKALTAEEQDLVKQMSQK